MGDAEAGGIRRFVPILQWLPKYDRQWLRFDLVAGATVGAAGTGVDRVRRARGVARASAQAETFATKYGYEFDPNQELIALGVANAGPGLLGGLAATRPCPRPDQDAGRRERPSTRSADPR